MTRISVLTPTNNSRWLRDAYDSLEIQDMEAWEWIVLRNNDAQWSGNRRLDADLRVKYYNDDAGLTGIGALKRRCAELATGDILVELDHDDLLAAGALRRVLETFEANPDAGMVYSNCCRVNADGSPNRFGDGYGWEYRKCGTLLETVSPAAVPQNIRRIEYAPDHLRAWRATEYWRLGGHSPDLAIADDHDLTCRFYIGSKIIHIDEPLYIYRIHGENNWLKNIEPIQAAQWVNYDNYAVKMFTRWAVDSGLAVTKLTDWNWQAAEDNSIGVMLALEGMELMNNPVAVTKELYRALAHGGLLSIRVPSTDGRGAFTPLAKSFWNELSFRYYTQAAFRDLIPGLSVRFQQSRLITYFPSDWHRANQMPFVQCDLIALKEGPRFHGELLV